MPENSEEKTKKSIFKKWWFWLILIIVIGFIASQGETSNNYKEMNKIKLESKSQVAVIDFSTMAINDITVWCDNNKIECYKTEEYSDIILEGAFIRQSVKAGEKIYEGDKITITYSLGKEPSKEFKNALKKAESYSEMMYMSKQSIYDQLTSEYGEQFPKDAAQYAIDNLVADFNSNALEKAKTYQETMNMSKSAIYDQLISKYGEKFTKEEAQYAIDHLND